MTSKIFNITGTLAFLVVICVNIMNYKKNSAVVIDMIKTSYNDGIEIGYNSAIINSCRALDSLGIPYGAVLAQDSLFIDLLEK